MVVLLGTSIRVLQSFEQGWRHISHYGERQALFLLAARKEVQRQLGALLENQTLPAKVRETCPAWQF